MLPLTNRSLEMKKVYPITHKCEIIIVPLRYNRKKTL